MRPKDGPPKKPGYMLDYLTHRPFVDLKDQLKAKRRRDKQK